MAWIWLPVDLDERQQRELSAEVSRSWALYGELHLTNAPRGRGLTMLDPRSVDYKRMAREAKSGDPR
jgi:hypothetical protein